MPDWRWIAGPVLVGGLGLVIAWLLRLARTRRIARDRLLPPVKTPSRRESGRSRRGSTGCLGWSAARPAWLVGCSL
ncbi:MAG: hypothetical protein ACKO38_11390, partial [Planctomycetota bacterium]